jgi:uncharacterized protein YjbI with pentapeptide repeats
MSSSLLSSWRARLFGAPAGPPSAVRKAQPDKLDSERLVSILERHRKWLASKGKQGGRADLRGAVLSRGGGRIANFSLRLADLRGASLRSMRLENVVLADALLRDADLSGANLAEAKGLAAEQLAGVDLGGASLHASLQPLRTLRGVPESARAARTLLILLLLTCLYALVTAATTTDASLFLNSPSSPLPLLGANIRMPLFYWVAPPTVFLMFVTLHLYLLRLWSRLTLLPAVFPDGGTLDQHVPPWLFNGFPLAYFPRLKARRPPLFVLQHGLAILLAWTIAPLTLLALWLRYLVRHDALGSTLHVLLLVAAVALGTYFHALTGAILRGELAGRESVEERPNLWRRFTPAQIVLSALLLGAFTLYSVKAVGGFGLKPIHVPDLSFSELSGANLRGNDLAGADLSRARLVAADFRKADLRRATLDGAMMSKALFSGAKLDGASLLSSKLDGADFRGASLQNAHLDGADLSAATLSQANLARARIRKADLRRAALDSALLAGADLTGSDLTGADVSFTRAEESRFTEATLIQATLRTINLTAADLTRARLARANLEHAMLMQINGTQADLGEANLQAADLKFSSLQGADLRQANLAGADIRGANLQDALFGKANLNGADLTETNVDCIKLAFATFDGSTRLPDRCARNRLQ